MLITNLYSLSTSSFLILFSEPLYPGAPLSTRASMLAINQFAVNNRLSYRITAQLLELLKIHLPSPNALPNTLYKLQKIFTGVKCKVQHFCSVCLQEVPSESNTCPKRTCIKRHSQLCYFTVLPFEEHLQQMFTGILYVTVNFICIIELFICTLANTCVYVNRVY